MPRKKHIGEDILLPYQKRWVQDRARFKIGLWARQTGKSFSTAAEAVLSAVSHGSQWIIVSAGERQAIEWMGKARAWAEAIKAVIEDYQEFRDTPQALLKRVEITWPGGGRIIALPANPQTVRGYTANVVLDEFAFHDDPDAIWRAVFPSVSNPLAGHLCVRVVSTPNGLNNRFAQLWFHGGNLWSRHKITIHDAVQDGLRLDVDELRAALGDPEAWAQEYECEFLDSSAVLLPYELLAQVESPEAMTHTNPQDWDSTSVKYIGIDFGRSRDLTVAWTVQKVGDVFWTIDVLELRNTPTPEQAAALTTRIGKARLVALDYTGSGIGLGDWLIERFGLYDPSNHKYGRIMPCRFSQAFVCEIFGKLRGAIEEKRVRIPPDREIREDLHSVRRVALANGITYKAPHTKDGHADRAVALALALHAARTAERNTAYIDPDRIILGQGRFRPSTLII